VFEQGLRRDPDIGPKIIDDLLGVVDYISRIFLPRGGRALAPCDHSFRYGDVTG